MKAGFFIHPLSLAGFRSVGLEGPQARQGIQQNTLGDVTVVLGEYLANNQYSFRSSRGPGVPARSGGVGTALSRFSDFCRP